MHVKMSRARSNLPVRACAMYVPPALRVDFTDVIALLSHAAGEAHSREQAVALAKSLRRIAADLRRQAVALRACHDQISAAVRDRPRPAAEAFFGERSVAEQFIRRPPRVVGTAAGPIGRSCATTDRRGR
jgi:hypothetical protein